LTFGGLGQGEETNHDVWRAMSYARLDGIRVREAALGDKGSRVVAELQNAYPEKLGVTSFVRSFEWDGASRVTLRDEATLREPRTVEWHLQSDTPFEGKGARYENAAGLAVVFVKPADLALEAGRATVKSPGPPGTIETGPEEERGYRLTARRVPGTVKISLDVELRLPR
jgi:hypothetical protein